MIYAFSIVFEINFADLVYSRLTNEVDKYKIQYIPMFQLETH